MGGDRRRKNTPDNTRKPDDQPNPLEGRPDEPESGRPEYPRPNTEQVRERKPGKFNRDEIRERTHRINE